ncbi:hypothetical protein FS749_008907 [Ceratobasidium sp. UAMH 11750]|nr:hypothetical protein FS749_008907 [Ceratobasidium sp. UAMH 11750]
MLGESGKYSWLAWNSPNASPDNLSNCTASISSSSSPVDSAPLTDSPHCSPLNVVWDTTPKAPTLGLRGYPSPGEWEYDISGSPGPEQLGITLRNSTDAPATDRFFSGISPIHYPKCTRRSRPLSLNRPTQNRYTHSSIGSNASGYSPGLPVAPFDSIQTSDADAELAGGMISLSVDESAPRSAHNSNHGRAVTYAGGFGVSDVQASGIPTAAPLTPTGPAPRG